MDNQYLTKLRLENFTVFEKLEIGFSPGINIFLGKNGTGKTHLLKILYSACDITKTGISFHEKIARVFLPLKDHLARLVTRQKSNAVARIEVESSLDQAYFEFTHHITTLDSIKEEVISRMSNSLWQNRKIECTYIPVKEILANAPGFRSLYARTDIPFEEIYTDIIDRAFFPKLKGPIDSQNEKLLKIIQACIHGEVVQEQEVFFLQTPQGKFEFMLVAEGMRKLALLGLLIQNGTLQKGSILFWDEPEANLNPSMLGTVVEILLELQRIGVQIFLATHDYVLLKEFDQRTQKDDSVRYHSLYFGDDKSSVHCSSTDHYLEIDPNAISETFQNLFTREVERALTGKGNEDE